MVDGVSLTVLAAVVFSYFLGNLSPATIMGKLHGVDIRKAGSGNPGTTNTFREIGPAAAGITLLIDILKGCAAVLIGRYFLDGGIYEYICGTAVFLGHIWPVCYKFKGGKGIATGFGVMLVLNWKVGLLLFLIAAAGALISRRMSVGSVAAALAVPVSFGIVSGGNRYIILWGLALCAIILWRHRSNIQRLMRGEEPPIGLFEKLRKEKTEEETVITAAESSPSETEEDGNNQPQ
ncbi:MAG: glycerol-3-phosphate 1-O-acyltransferase PlsY [Firmicutes bacterium]|nr:glycerol-3-phosphate 1-O-acyltransferase PlsY [Bacillota bacterium]